MSTLTIEHLSKSFKSVEVLKDVSLHVDAGEFISLLGPSGCGKTTLLRCIAGLERVSSGQIRIGDREVTNLPPEQRHLGMMFQSYALFPHMSVRENVRFGLRMEGTRSKTEQRELTMGALERVQMAHLADRMPAQLSGGQQQRVALARAIAHTPALLLLDEPLSNLDARLREDMQIELKELHRSLGLTTIFVTHDQQEALSLSDRIVLMNGGRIEQLGTPDDIYLNPASVFAADFIGAANLIEAHRVGAVAVTVEGSFEIPVPAGEGDGYVMVRQEDMLLAAHLDASTPYPVQLVAQAFRGADVVYVVHFAGQQLKVVVPGHAGRIALGEAALGVRPGTARWIPKAIAESARSDHPIS